MNETTMTDRFVEALRQDTQAGILRWSLTGGKNSPALCSLGGRTLVLNHNQTNEIMDAHTLISTDDETGESVLLMGSQTHLDAPCILRDLYVDILESIKEQPDPAVAHMQAVITQSVERQCVYAILDALKLLQSNLTCILQSIQ